MSARVHQALKLLRAAIVLATILVALPFARHALATTYKLYDDEGYVLLSLDHYLGGGHLYTDVFSQYGPFYFFVQGAVFRLLHLPVNHDAGRLVTLMFWLASAGLAAYFVYRISRDTILASAAGLACVVLVRDMSFEPGHPQQVILPALMLACCASAFPESIGLLILGALGTALFFTKINVGVFYLAALAHTLVCRFPAGRIRSAAVGMSLVYALGFPWIVMRQHFPGAAAGFGLLAAVCCASTFLVASLTMPPAPRPVREPLAAAAGAFSAAVLILAETMRQGMSLTTLLDGVVWAPLRHPRVYSVLLEVSGIHVVVAVLIAGCAIGLHRFRARWQDRPDWIGALQCAIGVCAIPLLAVSAKNSSWVLPFLPLGLLRARDLGPFQWFPRVFVTCLAATQFLQIYPVAGTQVAIAASPLMLWAFVCVHDGAGGLFRLLRRATVPIGDPFPNESVLGGLLFLGFAVTAVGSGACSLSYPDPPSGLSGAASLHLPADRAAAYRFLAGNIKSNCDILFTLPGMGSFNYWSGVPTPNGWNLTAWVKGFSPERQQQILDILQAHPRACAIYSDEMARSWGDTPKDLEASPLARYITSVMPKVGEAAGYEIHVHPQRDSPWIVTVTKGGSY
ncbi:MAG: hypothetical protein ACLQU1_06430 [Bryobacteraceae bacterium]